MEITLEEKNELEAIYKSFFGDERIKRMQSIPMHRGSNCYIHSFKVAKLAVKRALRHKSIDLKTLLLGAILHDYYLYDWRTEKDKKMSHCASHPKVSIANAVKDFDIPTSVQNIIRTHMWPFNLDEFPNTKEGRILTLADKSVFWREVFTSKKHKIKNNERYLNELSSLFD